MALPESSFSRRRFLRLAAAASAGALISAGLRAAPAGALRERAVPASGERLPVVGLGTWRTFSLAEREASRAVLARFVELGGKLVDTSPMYGDAEQAIGEIGRELDVLSRLFLATKVWTRGRREGEEQIRRSGRLLGRTPIDLVQIHNLVDWREHMVTLKALREADAVRHVGITHYVASAHAELERILRAEPVDFVQVNYNIGVRDAEARLLPAAADRGVAVIVNRPYGSGELFARVRGHALPEWAAEFDCASFGQLFLKFILSHDAVTCAIPATSKVRHLEDNLAAASGPLPDPATRKRMVQWFEQL